VQTAVRVRGELIACVSCAYSVLSKKYYLLFMRVHRIMLSALKDCLELKKLQFSVTFKGFFKIPSENIRD
jgi:hypothetical protein